MAGDRGRPRRRAAPRDGPVRCAARHRPGLDETAQIAEAATQGRVDTLFVAAEPWCWEQVTDGGRVVQLGTDEAFAPCEQLDRAITDTLSHGGQVYAVQAAEVAGGGTAAASFRY